MKKALVFLLLLSVSLVFAQDKFIYMNDSIYTNDIDIALGIKKEARTIKKIDIVIKDNRYPNRQVILSKKEYNPKKMIRVGCVLYYLNGETELLWDKSKQ